jgi:hypothetical protein
VLEPFAPASFYSRFVNAFATALAQAASVLGRTKEDAFEA